MKREPVRVVQFALPQPGAVCAAVTLLLCTALGDTQLVDGNALGSSLPVDDIVARLTAATDHLQQIQRQRAHDAMAVSLRRAAGG